MPGEHLRRLVKVAALCSALSLPAGAQDPGGQSLEAVQAGIQALQRRLAQQHVELDAGQRALRDRERAVAERARELDRIREDRDAQRQQAERLGADAAAVRERLIRERRALAEQVRMTYLAGQREVPKLVLNQESPALLGRLLVYYEYLNRARGRKISAVSGELATQERLAAESGRVLEELAALERAQADELAGLERAREQRRQLIATIEQDIRGADRQLQRLLDEERRLTQVVAEVDALAAEYPLQPGVDFRGARGRLAWPVQGSLVNDYGESRVDGQLRWKGVMVGAPRGSAVRSVHQGRVVYADWLPGLGLLVIVDHGMGYMSLYGHNEAILTESGVDVASGQPIARVGDSGGQRQSALYFEIRQNGDPVDPRPWMSGRLSR